MMNFTTLQQFKKQLPCPEKNAGQKREYKYVETLEVKGKGNLETQWKEKPQVAKFKSEKVWGKWTWVYIGEIALV